MVSDYKERSIARRDARRTASPEIRAPSASKRDTKRWCRGKIGVEHEPKCVDYNAHKRVTLAPEWKLLVCTKCGKELDSWTPVSWWPTRQVPPTWVTTERTST